MNQQRQQQQQQQQHGKSAEGTKNHRCDHGEEPRLKTRKLSQPILQLQLLPDMVLVHIGESVAKLCGIRDFLRLSQTSKHFKNLLMDSEKIVSNVIRIRTSRINHSTMLLPSFSSAPIVIHTLKQLVFFENCCGYVGLCPGEEQEHTNLLERSHISFENEDPFSGHINQSLLSSVYMILEKYPSAYVVLDAHCSSHPGTWGAEMMSEKVGYRVGDAISGFRHRRRRGLSEHQIRIRAWGREVASTASKSQHPYADMVKKGVGWVEIFLCMGPDDPSTTLLELPPRPDFYQNIPDPEAFMYEEQSDSDSYQNISYPEAFMYEEQSDSDGSFFQNYVLPSQLRYIDDAYLRP